MFVLNHSTCRFVRYSRHFEFVSVDGSLETAIEDLDAAAERAANQLRSVLAPTQTTDGVEIRDVLGFRLLPLSLAWTPVVDTQPVVGTNHHRL